MTNETNCILRNICTKAATPSCTPICEPFIAIKGRLQNAHVPKEYSCITVLTSPVRDEQSRIYKSIDAYVSSFIRQFEASDGYSDSNEGRKQKIKSLYLISDAPGTGKTTTAVAILNEWLIRHYIGSLQRNRQPLERPAYFLDVNAWQTLFNQFNRSNIPKDVGEKAATEYYRRMHFAKTVPFAVLDDIGVRNATEAFRGDLHDVINYRVANGLPTVYTSNVEMNELTSVFDERLYDRVRDLTIELYFEGESKRGIKR